MPVQPLHYTVCLFPLPLSSDNHCRWHVSILSKACVTKPVVDPLDSGARGRKTLQDDILITLDLKHLIFWWNLSWTSVHDLHNIWVWIYTRKLGGRWGEEVQYSNGANPAAVVPHSRFRLRDSCEISVMEHPQRSTKLNFLKSNLQEVTSC